MNFRSIAVTAILLAASAGALRATIEDGGAETGSASNIIINKYLAASSGQVLPSSMELEINASVPKLKQHGKLRALRKISDVGKITYRVLGFQGDNTIKKEVIARYLQAEQQSQGNPTMMLTPANYKFKLKGQRTAENRELVYVFSVSPLKKRVGLFRGELWLDAKSCLPVLEKGRLVKNPSVFFRKVDFERAFAIQNGSSVPAHMTSTIETRVVGTVELDINYTAVEVNAGEDSSPSDTDDTAADASLME